MPRAVMTALAATLAFMAHAGAQDWPTRQVTMVYPFAAGSPGDALGRLLASRLSELLGQPVIFENVGGAGGIIGANRVARSAPDGYQILLGGIANNAIDQVLYKRPPYNAATDFAPVALLVEMPVVLIARKDLPANNLQEFIAYARANHASMRYGSGGVGSGAHVCALLLNAAIGIKITHVPYRGGGQAMQDLMAGRIDYFCALASIAIPQMESRNVKALAILSKDRSPVMPALATAREQGLANVEFDIWYAFFLPKGTPAPIVQKLHDAAVATIEMPAVQQRLRDVGATVVAPERRSSDYLQKFVESEIERWGAVIKAAGVSLD
jgi:tripartite-type tricarboxylate transporter receptor subunit TctC